MVKKISLFLLLIGSFVSDGFAVDCENGDEKFVKIDATQIGTNMYNKNLHANKLQKYDYSFDFLYTGGQWAVGNKDSDDFMAAGTAVCLDSEENSGFDKMQYGTYCWCKLESVDNYRVVSDWRNVKNYNQHKFDEDKYADKPDKKQQADQERERKKNENIQDCMSFCASTCQSKVASLIRGIQGYYVCDTALYKLTNVKCAIDNKFLKAKFISVFDDVAVIETLISTIGLTRDTTSKNDFVYVGEYEKEKIYLKVKDKRIYVGRKPYSMEECL